MNEAVKTLDGWYTLHDFRTIDWRAWKRANAVERKQALDELRELTRSFSTISTERRGSYGLC